MSIKKASGEGISPKLTKISSTAGPKVPYAPKYTGNLFLGSMNNLSAAGLSAYELAIANGFVGTEDQWLISLTGPQGPIGPEGEPGIYATGVTTIITVTQAEYDALIPNNETLYIILN